MARDPTRYSRVSVGWVDSAQSNPDVDASDTGPVFNTIGRAGFSVGSGKSAADESFPGEIVITDTHLYVGDSSGSFRVVDTSDLTQ